MNAEAGIMARRSMTTLSLLDRFAAKVLPRLAGILASYLVGEASKRFGLTLDQAQVTGLMLVAYAGVHRWISEHTNPGDATKSVLIQEDKAIVAAQPAAGVAAPAAAAQPKAVPHAWVDGKEDGEL